MYLPVLSEGVTRGGIPLSIVGKCAPLSVVKPSQHCFLTYTCGDGAEGTTRGMGDNEMLSQLDAVQNARAICFPHGGLRLHTCTGGDLG